MASDDVFVVKELRKSFGKHEVLHDISLSVQKKEFIAIVGKSGCGKSTLLRLLAELDHPSSGTIERGNDHTSRMMFQDGRLLAWKSVLENVKLGLKKDAAHRAEQALKSVQLQEKANDWPSSLSGGQQQRVALARALVHSPDLLLLDEPLGALDALTRRDMQSLVEKIWAENELSIVLVTHDIEEAVALADRVLIIEEGTIVREDRVDLARPRDRTNRQFVQQVDSILRKVLGQEGGHTIDDEQYMYQSG